MRPGYVPIGRKYRAARDVYGTEGVPGVDRSAVQRQERAAVGAVADVQRSGIQDAGTDRVGAAKEVRGYGGNSSEPD